SVRDGCEAAIAMLVDHGIRRDRQSRWFETAPVPISDQPWFMNVVLLAHTALSPEETLEQLHAIESQFGRTRNVRNEARVLDIDLLDYDGEVIDEPSLTLPHPRLHQRAFVLMPLRDILPEWTHPKTGDDLTAMISALPAEQDIRAMAE
ncbi:MAG: 2-amino-4-hydroxy-6-hydroxymethyldihydropteridine diphosphokinase, partial [Alphaproteobacteria bacterium]